MSLINAEGFYHGVIVDNVFNQSTGGFPQEVWTLIADEVYDEETDSYLPWDANNAEIKAYLILIDSKDKETKTGQQVKKITGWDDGNFNTLDDMVLTDMRIGFRVGYGNGDYADVLGVSWVDTIDAPPFRTVQKCTKEEVAALQQRYASTLASNKAPTKPVSAKAPAKTPAKAPIKPKTKGMIKPKAPAKPKPTAPKVPKTTVGKCSADDAYQACYSLKRDDVTDDQLNEKWHEAVAAVNADESKISEQEWFQIKEGLLKEVSKV